MSQVVSGFLKMNCLCAPNFYCVDEFAKTQIHPAKQQVRLLLPAPADHLVIHLEGQASLVEQALQQSLFVLQMPLQQELALVPVLRFCYMQ